MRRRTLTHPLGAILLSMLVAEVAGGPVAGNTTLTPSAVQPQPSADLGTFLLGDGTFRGASGIAGPVDSSAWTLTSDLTSGEPPRFAPAGARIPRRPSGGYWSALGSYGVSSVVRALAVAGGSVYVGGDFVNAAGIPEADYVARWNGAGDGAVDQDVSAISVSGTAVYAGGRFTNVAGIPEADRIARWDGTAWSALGSNGAGGGAINTQVLAIAVFGSDLYAGGQFTDAAGIPEADYVAKWRRSPRQPDGRIRLGTGAYVGDDLYDATATGQKRRGSAAPHHTLTFGISVQNDGTSADRFKLEASGGAVMGYRVKYFDGVTDITADVMAGTYRTPSLAAGASHSITARVDVKPSAAVGSSVKRLVIFTSVGDPTRVDAVKFVGKRA